MASLLATLSTELVLHIFSFLDLADLARAKRLNSYFNNAIENSTVLSYQKALAEMGMVEGVGGRKYDAQHKLEMLTKRREAWYGRSRLDRQSLRKIHIPLNHAPSHIYDLTGGVYFLGDCYDQMETRRTLTLRYLDLSTQEPGLSRWESLVKRKDSPWPEMQFEGQIVDFGAALEEHDLLVVMCKETDPSDPDVIPFFPRITPRLFLHLVQFSTGKPHPLAEKATIEIFSSNFPSYIPPWTRFSVMIEIVGPRLVVLVSWKTSFREIEGRDSDHFFVINWWTGRSRSLEDVFGHQWDGFVFLSEDLVLRPNIARGYLEVIELPDVVNDTSEKVDSSNIKALLLLPQLAAFRSFIGMACRADPNPFGRPHPSLSHLPKGAGGWKSYHDRPFYPAAEDAIILFKPTIKNDDMPTDTLRYCFVIHRSAILRVLSTPSSQEEQCACFQEAEIVNWEDWGQENTRWSVCNDMDSPWITISSGQRVVFNRPGKITIRDFNPYCVKRASTSENSRANAYLDFVPFSGLIFTKEIRHGLPFLETDYEGDENFRGAIINEDYVLGLTIDPSMGTVEGLHIFDTGQL